jgi:hypothetical protein
VLLESLGFCFVYWQVLGEKVVGEWFFLVWYLLDVEDDGD